MNWILQLFDLLEKWFAFHAAGIEMACAGLPGCRQGCGGILFGCLLAFIGVVVSIRIIGHFYKSSSKQKGKSKKVDRHDAYYLSDSKADTDKMEYESENDKDPYEIPEFDSSLFSLRENETCMTYREFCFYVRLRSVLSRCEMAVYPKVPLREFLKLPTNEKAEKEGIDLGNLNDARKARGGKNVDFLVCDYDKDGGKILFALEYDDPHHETDSHTIKRDEAVKEMLDSAGVPLVRLKYDYSLEKGWGMDRLVYKLSTHLESIERFDIAERIRRQPCDS